MAEMLGTSILQPIDIDTMEPQVLSYKSDKGVKTLARRGKRGRKR
jgi:hypothetical protein